MNDDTRFSRVTSRRIAYATGAILVIILVAAAWSLLFGPNNIIDGGMVTIGPKCDGTTTGEPGCSDASR